jgi:hypothetical protein
VGVWWDPNLRLAVSRWVTAYDAKLDHPKREWRVPARDGREIDRVTAAGFDIDILNGLVIAMTATDQLWDIPGLWAGLTRGERLLRTLGRA